MKVKRIMLLAFFVFFAVLCFSSVAQAVELEKKGLEVYFKAKDHDPYVSGYGDNTFRPNDNITRAEAAQMLYSLLCCSIEVTGRPFTDISSGQWYEEAVFALTKIGIFHGYEDGTFRPNHLITREELVTALAACVPFTNAGNPFSDVSTDSWAYRPIITAVSHGWISGYPDGTFRPQKTISRAEAVVIVNKALERTGKGFAENHTGKYFTDLAETHWAYQHIVEASGAVAGQPNLQLFSGKKQLQVTASSLNLRSGPSESSRVLMVLGKNTVLDFLEKTNAPWLNVSTQDGMQGYIYENYVEEYVPSTVPAERIKLSANSVRLAQYQSFRLDGVSTPGTTLKWSSSDTDIVTVSTMRYGEGDESCFLYGKAPGTAVVYCSDYNGNVSAACSVTVQAAEPVRFAFTEPNLVTAEDTVRLIAITDAQKTNVLFIVEDIQGNHVFSQSISTYQTEHYKNNETHVFQCPAGVLKPGEYRVKVHSGKMGDVLRRDYCFDITVHTSEAVDVTTSASRDISDTMIGMMMDYESYIPVICDDAAAPKNPTIGYGFVVNTNRVFYNGITSREAKALLLQQINKVYGEAVNNFREKNDLRMSQSQYDALVSFTYNLGPDYMRNPSGNCLFTSLLNAVIPPENISEENPCPAVLNVKNAGLYTEPIGNAKEKSNVPKGASLQVIGIERNEETKELWYMVKTDSESGWMRGGNICLDIDAPIHDLNYTDSITFSTYWLAYHHTSICEPGLLYRRLREAKLFNHADYEQASPKHKLSAKNTYHYIYPDCVKGYE